MFVLSFSGVLTLYGLQQMASRRIYCAMQQYLEPTGKTIFILQFPSKIYINDNKILTLGNIIWTSYLKNSIVLS